MKQENKLFFKLQLLVGENTQNIIIEHGVVWEHSEQETSSRHAYRMTQMLLANYEQDLMSSVRATRD